MVLFYLMRVSPGVHTTKKSNLVSRPMESRSIMYVVITVTSRLSCTVRIEILGVQMAAQSRTVPPLAEDMHLSISSLHVSIQACRHVHMLTKYTHANYIKYVLMSKPHRHDCHMHVAWMMHHNIVCQMVGQL